MSKQRSRSVLMVGLVLLVATGCLRSANDTDVTVPQARELSSPTPSPSPATAAVIEVERTVEVVVTATPDPSVTFGAQVAETEEIQANVVNVPESTAVAQVDNPAEATLRQQATDIIATATQEAIDATETALGPPATVPTLTATPNTAVTAPPTQRPVGSDCIHQVRAGENLFRLSLYYGVPVANIAAASGVVNQNLIVVGQRLTIPGCGTTGAVPPPTFTPSPTFSLGVPGGTTGGTTGGSAGGVQHTVQQYETLFEISQRYGVPVMTIAAANGITNPDLIKMNTVLTIP